MLRESQKQVNDTDRPTGSEPVCLLYIFDRSSSTKFLVDTDAQICAIPVPLRQHTLILGTRVLQATDGSPMKTWPETTDI